MTRPRPTPLPHKRLYRAYQRTGLRATARIQNVSYASMRRLMAVGHSLDSAIAYCHANGLTCLTAPRAGYAR